MLFDKTDLQDLVYEYGDASDGSFELLTSEIVDTSRWSIMHEAIFRYKDKFYRTCYSVGATESQDERPYEYDADQIECPEVKPVQVTITKYVDVE